MNLTGRLAQKRPRQEAARAAPAAPPPVPAGPPTVVALNFGNAPDAPANRRARDVAEWIRQRQGGGEYIASGGATGGGSAPAPSGGDRAVPALQDSGGAAAPAAAQSAADAPAAEPPAPPTAPAPDHRQGRRRLGSRCHADSRLLDQLEKHRLASQRRRKIRHLGLSRAPSTPGTSGIGAATVK